MPQYPYNAINNDLRAVVSLSAATANGNSAVLTNSMGRGVRVNINITALTGTSPTLTVTIRGYDAASASYFTLLASTALNATGFTSLLVYPGAAASANVSANNVVPQKWDVSYTLGGTTPAITATIGAQIQV